MAHQRGLRVMVNAPNRDTNSVLTSPGVQAACMQVAGRLAQQMYSATAQDGRESVGEKKHRYPIVLKQPVAARFNGTVRCGAKVVGNHWGMRADLVEQVMKAQRKK